MPLEVTWFYIWGFLWVMYFITDGFVLGIGSLYPFIGRTDDERRIILNTVGPLWDGNEVWLITAGAITFGAFPVVYAVLFTSFYTPLMLILFCLIIRGVSFEFRSKIEGRPWRRIWDGCIFVSSLLAALLLGVAFGNIFKGVLLDQDGVYHGNLLSLMNPYGLLSGLLFVLLFVQHGLNWLCIKTNGELRLRSEKAALSVWPLLTAGIVLFLIMSWAYTDFFENRENLLLRFLILTITVLGLIFNRTALKRKRYFQAWFSSAITIGGAAFFGLTSIFPRLLPSSIDSAYSLTAHNSSADPSSLKIMLVVVAVFIPLVMIYQAYAYNLFKDKVTSSDIQMEESY